MAQKLILALLPLLSLATAAAQPRFTDITDSAGIDHVYAVHEGLFGGGVTVIDFNGDGYEDLYLTSGLESDQLLRNNGDGTFTDVFAGSGLELTDHFVTQGAVTADFNRDSLPDLFVTTITSTDSLQIIPRARNLLFLGRADGTFVDATEDWGLVPLYSFSTGPSVGDFDNDGWPDLYVGNYFVGYENKLDHIDDAITVSANQTAYGYLLRNEEGRGFRDVYREYGLQHRGFGFGAVFTDYDLDGDQDMLVNHDFGYKNTPNLLLENQYPEPKFIERGEELGLDLGINAMSTAVGDPDRDGRFDYYFTSIKFNQYMVPDPAGTGRYVDATKRSGLNYLAISWGTNFADFDLDGDEDLFVSNGDLNPNCQPMVNFYFDNEGGTFTENALAVGLADHGVGRGSAVFDLDNDGDLDLLAVSQIPVRDGYPVPSVTRLYRNDAPPGHWLKVRLRGTSSEASGLGSRVTAYLGGTPLLREVDGGSSSHLSQSSRLLHFGLGDADHVDSLVVVWNGGQYQRLGPQQSNQLITIVQPPAPAANVRWSGGLVAVGLFLAVAGLFVWLIRRRR